MPDPRKILTTIRRATELMRATPGRSGGIISPVGADEIMVVGDLHGNIPAFKQVLKLAALDRNPRRHLILQELIHGKLEYPDDKGDRSHQLLDIVAALKIQYPDRVHLILGNHELSELTGRIIAKDGKTLNMMFRMGICDRLWCVRRRDLRGLQGALRRAPAGDPHGQSRLRLPHAPGRVRPRRPGPRAPQGRHLARGVDEASRDDLRDDLGPRHRPRRRRSIRRDG